MQLLAGTVKLLKSYLLTDWEDVTALVQGGEVKGGDKWHADVVTESNGSLLLQPSKVPKLDSLQQNKPLDNWIIWCRDPDDQKLDLLIQKRDNSLAEFNADDMSECIIMHEVDPEDLDCYQVIVLD